MVVRITTPGQKFLCRFQSQLDAFAFQGEEVFEKMIQCAVSYLNESPVGKGGSQLFTMGSLLDGIANRCFCRYNRAIIIHPVRPA
jgi:hypothetical protein